MTSSSKRKTPRLKPDLNAIAVVSTGSTKIPNYVGLVIDESKNGCRVAFLSYQSFKKSQDCLISIGSASPQKAEVVWRKDIGANVSEIGFSYRD